MLITEGKSIHKLRHNAHFAKQTIKAMKSIGQPCLYLDGPNARTTKTLLRHKISKKYLIPVNKDKYPQLAKCPNFKIGMVSQVIRQLDEPLSSIWLDYNGTFYGSYKTSNAVKLNDNAPCHDIEYILKKLTCHGTHLAFTVALSRKKGLTHKQEIQNIRNWLNKTLASLDLGKSRIYIEKYRGTNHMVRFSFNVCHRISWR